MLESWQAFVKGSEELRRSVRRLKGRQEASQIPPASSPPITSHTCLAQWWQPPEGAAGVSRTSPTPQTLEEKDTYSEALLYHCICV